MCLPQGAGFTLTPRSGNVDRGTPPTNEAAHQQRKNTHNIEDDEKSSPPELLHRPHPDHCSGKCMRLHWPFGYSIVPGARLVGGRMWANEMPFGASPRTETKLCSCDALLQSLPWPLDRPHRLNPSLAPHYCRKMRCPWPPGGEGRRQCPEGASHRRKSPGSPFPLHLLRLFPTPTTPGHRPPGNARGTAGGATSCPCSHAGRPMLLPPCPTQTHRHSHRHHPDCEVISQGCGSGRRVQVCPLTTQGGAEGSPRCALGPARYHIKGQARRQGSTKALKFWPVKGPDEKTSC